MKYINNCRLVIIGNLDYPAGSAPSNRTHAYAKALTEIGHNVVVLCTGAPYKKVMDMSPSGSFEGVQYIYVIGLYRRKNPLIRKFLNVISPLLAIYHLKNISKVSSDFALLEFSSSLFQEVVYRIFTFLYKIPVIREENEIVGYQFPENSFRLKFELFIFRKFTIHLRDAVIVISENLNEIFTGYQKKIRRDLKILKIPILVDTDLFKRRAEANICNDIGEPYIAYLGTMVDSKDGVVNLIKAFKLIHDKIPEYSLFLVGPVAEDQKTQLLDIADSQSIKEKIRFLGRLGRDEVVEVLNSASVLALARPSTRQTEAGFPTKLGEYLATGNPVVITRTGEIPNYLIDNFNAYVAEPGNIKEFADRLESAVSDRKTSSVVGARGRSLAEEVFNYKNYSSKLLEFIYLLNKKND